MTRMGTRPRGMALVVILLVSVVLLVLLFSAMAISSRNILFTANYRDRTAALYAAEAGVHEAIYELQKNPAYNSSVSSRKLQNTEAHFSYQVQNTLAANDRAVITSTGSVGSFQRTLRVTVQRAASSYNALTNDGPINLAGNVFINGIRSVRYPKGEPGNIHTNYSNLGAIEGSAKVRISGIASAMGTIGSLISDDHKRQGAPRQNIPSLSADDVIRNTRFTASQVPADGVIRADTEINGNLDYKGNLKLEDGKVLHVKGDLIVDGSITGKGKVVVDGKTTFKGGAEIDGTNADGVAIFSGDDLTVSHPTESTDSTNPVVDFFAAMPENASSSIASNLPADAPRNADFFDWYRNKSYSPDPAFNNWREGNPNDPGQPGLPTEVRTWLDSSLNITDQIDNWSLQR